MDIESPDFLSHSPFMSRKSVHQAKPPSVAASSSDAQERLALVHLEKGRYRDAIDAFKALLKTQRRPEWLEGLASAYAGRAQGLAAKDMRREAIELWRSRAEHCGTPLWEGPYVGWMVAEGRLADVLGYLATRRAAAPAEQRNDEIASLEARLAPALLVADDATLARLPAESQLVQHRVFAQAALAAYARKDASALEGALAAIPFRSPYRDLRLVLKAMVLWETDQDAARLAMDRLPADGPFEQLAAPLRALLAPGGNWSRLWATLNKEQQTIALDLLGCPPAFAPLLRALADADADVAPSALFDLVQRHARDLPSSLATRLWQWLAPWAVRRGCASPRIFGSPSPAAQECATALAVEIKGEWGHAEEHWSDAADVLASSKDADDRLRAALILRHMALHSDHLSRDGVLDDVGEEMLTKSLQYDLGDPDIHVRLVRFWRCKGDLKRARERLDAGLGQFPDHVALLAEGVETALAASAFKKAASTARRLLELDPLNSKVRSLVGKAHLSHAGKQIAADKLAAAKKEIEEAGNWLTTSVDQGRMQLLLAWTEPTGSAERRRLAQLAVAAWGGGLAAGWRLLREAQGAFARVGVKASESLLGEAGIDTAKSVTPADLLELAQVLEQEVPMVRKGQDPLALWRKAILGMAATPVFGAESTVRVCEALGRHEEHDLVEKFANAARKRWPDRPIFVYHAVAARFAKRRCIDSKRDYDDLEHALDHARRDKDRRLAMRIDALFEDDEDMSDFGAPGLPSRPGVPKLPVPKLPFNPAQLNLNMVREMIELSIKGDGEKAFLKGARTNLGDALYRAIEKASGGNHAAFVRNLVNLVAESIVADMAAPPPFVPTKISKPKKPVPGQGDMFNE